MAQTYSAAIRVVVADADTGELARTRALLLQDENIQIAALVSERRQLPALLALEPDLILLAPSMAPQDLPALVRQLLELSPRTQVLLIPDGLETLDVSRAVLAGARGILPKPLNAKDLLTTIHEIVENESTRHQRLGELARQREAKASQGRIITLFSPKGGVGCTLLACNLAIAIQSLTKKRVVLVDYSLQFGTIGSVLNLQAAHTVADLAPHYAALDSTILNDVLVRHSSGVQVLLPPADLQQVETITAESLSGILEELREHFDYVIVDTWHAVEEATLGLMDLTDKLLLVITPEVPALSTARRFLDMLKDYPELRGKAQLLVNRHPSRGGVALAEIERSLGMTALATIPSDGQAMTQAINEGVPVFQKDSTTITGRNLLKLAEALAVPADLPVPSLPAPAPGRRLNLNWWRAGA